jgi:hypothetical protein
MFTITKIAAVLVKEEVGDGEVRVVDEVGAIERQETERELR